MSGLTPDQLQRRRTFVGASEVPALLGISPFANAVSVWASKMGLVVQETTDAMKAGNYLEAGLGRWYADETGFEVASFGSVVHPKHPFMGCTPDLCVFGQRRIAQIKMVGTFMAHHWEDGVPDYVEAQVQAEMEVCDVDVCDVVALIGGTEFRIMPVERDRELGGYLVEVCRDFYERYVITREMPPVDGSKHSEEALKARFGRDKTGIILPNEQIDALAKAWLKANARLDEAKGDRDLLTNQLKAILGDAQGVDGDSYRIRWKTNATGARPFTLKAIALRSARAA